MYWPTSTSRIISLPPPIDQSEIVQIKPNKRGNLWAVVTREAVGVWEVRPTVMQACVVRSAKSLERWGENVEVCWAYDGRGLIILTATSHLLIYSLQSSSQPTYDLPSNTSYPSATGPGEGGTLTGWTLRADGTAFVMGGCTSLHAQPHSLLLTLRHPASILNVPWPIPREMVAAPGSHFPPTPLDSEGGGEVWELEKGKAWMGEGETSSPMRLGTSRTPGLPTLYTMLTEDGRVWGMFTTLQINQVMGEQGPGPSLPKLSPVLPLHQASPVDFVRRETGSSKYVGQVIYPPPAALRRRSDEDLSPGTGALGLVSDEAPPDRDRSLLVEAEKAVEVAVNGRFGLVAVGLAGGKIEIISLPPYPQPARQSHALDLKASANLRISPGRVTSFAWTSDGYGLAAGYEKGWAVWSMGGRLGGWGLSEGEDGNRDGEEGFMHGVNDLFWAPGNLELFVFAKRVPGLPDRVYSIPFAKSATTGQHSPDNTRYAFLQMDDRVLVYRGADQPDMSVINPESDVWQHIKIPSAYISTNWPIRYASISTDGRLVAVAGRRGFTHYSAASGRWKLFGDERQERGFTVRGGILWFHHFLVVAVEFDKSYQIRLYSRDFDLTDEDILHSQSMPSPVMVMSLLDNSLLVYTADNTLYHFLILLTKESIRLHLCGSISFQGIVQVPSRVRALSWLVPEAQKRLGDPVDDLIVATIIFLVDGKLVLLRPRRAGNEEVRYDMQVLADRIEAYWTHLHGVGTLENSLWGYDGRGMRIWLDALTIEATRVDTNKDAYETVEESVNLRLDFYPLSILMDKGIIIGVDYETSLRTLPFALFKIQTGTHLFLPKLLRYHLSTNHLEHALTFASNYSSLVYFAHSLEILLHSVLEDEVDTGVAILPRVIEFLDHFPESLDVVVGCARKTEIERWELLFDVVGQPRELFERCLGKGLLRTAASYLLVLHNLEELDDTQDTIRLLKMAMASKEFQLCKELLKFLHSIDEDGSALRTAIKDVGITSSSTTSVSPKNSPSRVTEITPRPSDFPTVPATQLEHTPRPGNAESNSPNRRGHQRVTSQFELSSPRLWTTPPSPRTVETVPDQPSVPDPGDEVQAVVS